MKKVFVLIDGQFQKTASGFIDEYEKLNGTIDGIICLRPNKGGLFFYVRKIVRIIFRILARIKNKLIGILINSGELRTIASLKDSWASRNENSWDLLDKSIDIFQYANSKSIPLHFVNSLVPETFNNITKSNPSLFILYAGGILSDEVLSIPGGEFLNAHMGDMPKYRGMNVLEWAVLEGSKPKVSVMVMNNKIDDGDIIYKMDIERKSEKTVGELRKTGYESCYKAMANAAYLYSAGKVNSEKQPREGIKYYYRMHDKIRQLLVKKLINS
jgi:methionyl-tRNA formyltransferase